MYKTIHMRCVVCNYTRFIKLKLNKDGSGECKAPKCCGHCMAPVN